MKDSIRDKKVTDAQTSAADLRAKARSEICEICGQELERDPESGEYICPACDYDDIQP